MTSRPLDEILFRERSHTTLSLEREVAAGGEGRIFLVANERQVVVKLYHQPTDARAVKLSIMLDHPPEISVGEQQRVQLAWPLDRIVNAHQECVGFLMSRIDQQAYIPLFKLYNPRDRHRVAPNFTWQYLLRTAANLASALEVLHEAGYVVGDLNESNILVSSRALVVIVDCDSIQVSSPDGETFRCPVGKPDYTPPELLGQDFAHTDRSPHHDAFALAVLIFLVLMEGVHPFAGFSPDSTESPLPEDHIRAGYWPYALDAPIRPPAYALPLNFLPERIQLMMRRCFLYGQHAPELRPTAQEWHEALREAEQSLSRCWRNRLHWYSNHLKKCPWCERKKAVGFDAFASARVLHLPSRPSQVAGVLSAPLRTLLSQTIRLVGMSLLAMLRGVLKAIYPVLIGIWIVTSCIRTFSSPSLPGVTCASPSCSPYQALSPTPTSPALKIYDPLNKNDPQVEWDEGATRAGQCTFHDGAYHVTAVSAGYYRTCRAQIPYFTDVTYQVQMEIARGDCGGVLFGIDDTNQTFYDFNICQDGSYELLYFSQTRHQNIVLASSPQTSAAIKKGLHVINLISVSVAGGVVDFYINDQHIGQFQNQVNINGQIGVVADGSRKNIPTEVLFREAKVWT